MAQLSPAERRQIATRFMSEASGNNESTGTVSKADIFAAIDAADAWIDTNFTAFRQALPATVRQGLTRKQIRKMFLLTAVARLDLED